MKALYRKFRSLGLNATRAFIIAKMIKRAEARDHVKISWTDETLAVLASSMKGWTFHQCRVYVQRGYA